MQTYPMTPLGVDRHCGQRPERIRVQFKTRLRLRDGTEIEAELRNVSRRGCMAECGTALEPGTDLLVHLPGIGWVLGRVRWTKNGRVGCKFPDAIVLARLWKTNAVRRPVMAVD